MCCGAAGFSAAIKTFQKNNAAGWLSSCFHEILWKWYFTKRVGIFAYKVSYSVIQYNTYMIFLTKFKSKISSIHLISTLSQNAKIFNLWCVLSKIYILMFWSFGVDYTQARSKLGKSKGELQKWYCFTSKTSTFPSVYFEKQTCKFSKSTNLIWLFRLLMAGHTLVTW